MYYDENENGRIGLFISSDRYVIVYDYNILTTPEIQWFLDQLRHNVQCKLYQNLEKINQARTKNKRKRDELLSSISDTNKKKEKKEEEPETAIRSEYMNDPDHWMVRKCWSWNVAFEEDDKGKDEEEDEKENTIDSIYTNQLSDNEHMEQMIEWIRENGARGHVICKSEKRPLGYRLAVTLTNHKRRQHQRRIWVFAGLNATDHDALLRFIHVNIPSKYCCG